MLRRYDDDARVTDAPPLANERPMLPTPRVLVAQPMSGVTTTRTSVAPDPKNSASGKSAAASSTIGKNWPREQTVAALKPVVYVVTVAGTARSPIAPFASSSQKAATTSAWASTCAVLRV